MSYISDTLRQAYERKGIPYHELAKMCKVSRPTIQRYVMGVTDRIDIEKLTAICSVLDVDVKQLIGVDKDSPDVDVKKNFGSLLERAIKDNGLSDDEAAELLKVTPSLLRMYINGERIPPFSVASAWAISLGIPIDEYDPLYKDPSENKENERLKSEIINGFSSLSPEKQKQVRDYIRFLATQEEGE